MFVITVKFTTYEKDTEKFKTRILNKLKILLNRLGCLVFDVCHDPKNINVVFLYEIYTNKDAFDIHLNSEHYLSFNEEVTPWVSEKLVSQLTKQIV